MPPQEIFDADVDLLKQEEAWKRQDMERRQVSSARMAHVERRVDRLEVLVKSMLSMDKDDANGGRHLN